jgi:hypothetical protein
MNHPLIDMFNAVWDYGLIHRPDPLGYYILIRDMYNVIRISKMSVIERQIEKGYMKRLTDEDKEIRNKLTFLFSKKAAIKLSKDERFRDINKLNKWIGQIENGWKEYDKYLKNPKKYLYIHSWNWK